MIPLNHRSVGRISLYKIHMNEKVDTHTSTHTYSSSSQWMPRRQTRQHHYFLVQLLQRCSEWLLHAAPPRQLHFEGHYPQCSRGG